MWQCPCPAWCGAHHAVEHARAALRAVRALPAPRAVQAAPPAAHLDHGRSPKLHSPGLRCGRCLASRGRQLIKVTAATATLSRIHDALAPGTAGSRHLPKLIYRCNLGRRAAACAADDCSCSPLASRQRRQVGSGAGSRGSCWRRQQGDLVHQAHHLVVAGQQLADVTLNGLADGLEWQDTAAGWNQGNPAGGKLVLLPANLPTQRRTAWQGSGASLRCELVWSAMPARLQCPAASAAHPKGSSICTPISSMPNMRKAKMPESSTENQE